MSRFDAIVNRLIRTASMKPGSDANGGNVVLVTIPDSGALSRLPIEEIDRVSRGIENRFGLRGWTLLPGTISDDAGEYWAYRRPAHRPRQDPTAARVNLVVRVHPDTRKRIAAEAERTGESQGQVIDRLAAGLDG